MEAIKLDKDTYNKIPAVITGDPKRDIISFEFSMAMWLRAIEEYGDCKIHKVVIQRWVNIDEIKAVKATVSFK